MDEVLVVVDVQVDYCLPEGKLGRLGRDMAPTVALTRALEPFMRQTRSLGTPIVIVRSETKTLCRPGTRGAELCIPTVESDHIVTKRAYNAFNALSFRRKLKQLAPRRLVFCGVDTHVCIESAVRQAFDLGYQVDVVTDLVATRGENRHLHEHSLQVMGKYFANLIPSEALIKRWSIASR